MPYKLTWEDRGVVAQYWGVITCDVLFQSNEEQKLDPRDDHNEYALGVFSNSVVFDVSGPELRRIAAMDAAASQTKPNFVVAIVAEQAVIHGLANMYRLQHEAVGGQWNTNFFTTEEEARRWIAEVLD